MSNPYQNAIAALAGTTRFERALDAMAYVAGLPELIEAAAARLARDGETFANEFPADAAAAEVAVGLGAVLRSMMTDPAANFGRVFRRVHEDELRRLEEPRHNEDRWDVVKNYD